MFVNNNSKSRSPVQEIPQEFKCMGREQTYRITDRCSGSYTGQRLKKVRFRKGGTQDLILKYHLPGQFCSTVEHLSGWGGKVTVLKRSCLERVVFEDYKTYLGYVFLLKIMF